MSAGPADSAPLGSATRLPPFLRALLFLVPFLIPVAAWGAGTLYYRKVTKPKPVAAAPALDGETVYARHCAYCHGPNGDGNGVAQLYPRARHFGAEKFKFASTVNGVPTDADLTKVVRQGLPGSAMPAFPQLSDTEVKAVIEYIRGLTRAGIYAQVFAKAVKDYDDGGDEPDPVAINRKVTALTTPGPLLKVPDDFGKPTVERIANGRQVYLKVCAACHGPEGHGDGPQVKDLKNDNKTPARPRDLTAGVYKADGDAADIYRRIRLGIPGTPMPATVDLSPTNVADLIHYVQSLAPPPPPKGHKTKTNYRGGG